MPLVLMICSFPEHVLLLLKHLETPYSFPPRPRATLILGEAVRCILPPRPRATLVLGEALRLFPTREECHTEPK